MATLPLTEKQEKLWRFIASCERSPSYAEMCEATGTSSVGSIGVMVKRLRDRGLISQRAGRWRSIVALAADRGTLEAWSDAELIAELECRTKAALGRAEAINSTGAPQPARKKGGSIFGTWQEQAKEASGMLLRAIELAGVRP
jgi:SOS-response transcriptional repressor LexA